MLVEISVYLLHRIMYEGKCDEEVNIMVEIATTKM